MKKAAMGLIGLMILAGCGGVGMVRPPQVQESTAIVWVGLDYSQTKMIGAGAFNDPDKIFPDYLNQWNDLFVAEMLPDLERRLGKQVVLDLSGIVAVNKKATKENIDETIGKREAVVDTISITDAQIADMVKQYVLNEKAGVGLVFIVERLVKTYEVGCVHTVYFDIATRQVISTQRGCYDAGGFGFRNYWFRVIKNAVAKL